MDNHLDRWAAFERDRTIGVPTTYDPTAGPNCSGVRIRKEGVARDSINSRAWDFFHATPPTQVSSEGLRQKQGPLHYDMNPISSRINTVQYRIQPSYIPDTTRGATTTASLGVAPAAGPIPTPPTTFSTNPYTQRLDAGGSDARNMIRELRSAVQEDNREFQTDADRALAARQFTDRWLPAVAAADAGSLQAYELLRPKQDDWRTTG